MTQYPKPPELLDGLRLHQNENTGGCSPRVLVALRALGAEQIGFYPPYRAAVEACARHFGVEADQIALTNGLDEGILVLAVTCLRPRAGGPVPEAVVPEPAFEVYRVDTAVAGGKLVQVPPSADFMASRFCYSIELHQAITRHDQHQARVLPILLRPTDWEGSPFAKLQLLPSNGFLSRAGLHPMMPLKML